MGFVYAVLGGGRQGTAAAYDMAKNGDADRVLVGDADLEAAVRSAARVNTLLGRSVAEAHQVDARDSAALRRFLEPVDSFLSAVPYWLNPSVLEAAIDAKACMCDLGGNTDLVREQMKRSDAAEAAGIAVVPDCGQVPGMGTALMSYAMTFLDRTEELLMWDGGNDQHPKPPFNYILTFNIAGLTNEYYGVAHFLRNGKRVEVPTFLEEDYETVDFGGKIGVMEAFVAGGGTSTMPWTYEGKVRTLWNKTLRWPGHFAQWKAYMDAGLLEEEPVDVDGVQVSPRALLHRVLDPKLRARPEDRDFVIVRVKGIGEKDGLRAEVLLDLIDYYDEATGFTAMERTTGWDGSITAILNAQGVTPRGVHPVELAVPGKRFAEELRKRGFSLKESFTIHRD
ncbi:saccharopine dehydrogenase family protein [Aminiphilus circumscriptus]|uniref:saccharopine dehydrogenase family protein n=1 Tax=Aminiphilus circumscriptus TaxID=290732 RepID=UPI00047864E6|nr:saccharopine dehydrogenase C-terminal domain-containing protein [Aminiphilus circumscriptus]